MAGSTYLPPETLQYDVPEALHAESALISQVISRFGAQVTKEKLRFIAFYAEQSRGGPGCGDCRDFEIANTDYQNLMIVCGNGKDLSMRVKSFMEGFVSEERFAVIRKEDIPLTSEELENLMERATTPLKDREFYFSKPISAAALTSSGRIYRAVGCEDAAFHYRYPIGGVLQQLETEQDNHLRVILVAGEKGKWPKVTYRDRQYGFEGSSKCQKKGMNPPSLLITDQEGNFRMTTFEEALPFGFSLP